MEKIEIKTLGEVIYEYKDKKPFSSGYSSQKAGETLAEKINEIIDYINGTQTTNN